MRIMTLLPAGYLLATAACQTVQPELEPPRAGPRPPEGIARPPARGLPGIDGNGRDSLRNVAASRTGCGTQSGLSHDGRGRDSTVRWSRAIRNDSTPSDRGALLVVTSEARRPLSDRVEVVLKDDHSWRKSAFTNSRGEAWFESLMPGPYVIEVEDIGNQRRRVRVDVRAGFRDTVSVPMVSRC